VAAAAAARDAYGAKLISVHLRELDGGGAGASLSASYGHSVWFLEQATWGERTASCSAQSNGGAVEEKQPRKERKKRLTSDGGEGANLLVATPLAPHRKWLVKKGGWAYSGRSSINNLMWAWRRGSRWCNGSVTNAFSLHCAPPRTSPHRHAPLWALRPRC